MKWYITNKNKTHYNATEKFLTNIDQDIYIDGYVVPRLSIYEYYKQYNQIELIRTLYKKYKKDFVHYIKGVFTIIIFNNDTFELYSDRHSIKKYFIYEDKATFFISNSLELISKEFSLNICAENAALFSLTSHFFSGITLFKNLRANLPAQQVIFSNDTLKILEYWKPADIFKNKINKNKNENYADIWSHIIASYIDYLHPKGVSLTLTGGNDSRMVLASLLAQKRDFHCFTFGNPFSYDGVIVSKLKESVNLSHDFYFVKNPTKQWFKKQADDLISYGQGLINIHRAHRNDAIIKEKSVNSEMIFTGLVGGEYFKEPSFDDIAIPTIFEKILRSDKKHGCNIIYEELKIKGINIDSINIESVYNQIEEFLQSGSNLSFKQRKFVYTYMFYGCAHHSQDSNVFGEHIKYVVNPFMDIDFIETMSTHPIWYVNKNIGFVNRLFHSYFFIEITNQLAPELSDLPYAKKGKYTANDLLHNRLLYLIKRLSYLIKKDNSYPANFPMGEWIYEYCYDEIKSISSEILRIVDIDKILDNLSKAKTRTTEKEWHIITNIINWNLIYEQYKEN